MAEEIGFFPAKSEVLDPLLNASALLKIIDHAHREGVLSLLRGGSDVASIARATGLSEDSARTLCAALVTNDIATDIEGGSIRLTPPWRALTDDGAFTPLGNLLAHGRVVDAMLAGGQSDYATLSTEDRSAFARSVSPNPYAPELVERARQDIAADPWWSPMQEGGRHLELGCGVAGRMLTVLQAMPRLHAVGIELDADLAAEARRRAADLGVADRVEIVTGDATTYRGDQPFDFAFWSQWFFPSATREAALASVFANLRSGGVVRAPVFGDHERIAADPVGKEAREYAIYRVMLESWGVPERTPQHLKAEFEDAGFTDVGIARRDIAITVYARRP